MVRVALGVLPVLCLALFPGAKAETSQRGSFETSTSLTEIFAGEAVPDFGVMLAPDKQVDLQLYVPPAYHSGDPAGVIVYTSPFLSGDVPKDWEAVLARRNIIWVSAEGSGNGKPDVRRMAEAVLGLAYVRDHYSTSETRVFAAGLSRGGQVSGLVMEYFPDVFTGALYICGAENLGEVDERQLSLMAGNRYVFLTGSRDFARHRTRRAYHSYKDAGIEAVHLLEVAGMAHENPDAEMFEEALSFLDEASGIEQRLGEGAP